LPATAGAQDDGGYGETQASGGIRISGSGNEAAPADAELGLEQMYGGVTGSTNPDGTKKGGPKKDIPELHVVKKGDTLWGISEDYYGNPWAWPKVWSLNPQLENPHWIYPGDQLRTAPSSAAMRSAADNSAGGGGFVGRGRIVPTGTVFIRDQGYIGDPERDVWGEVVGAHEDAMMLSDGSVIYVKMKEGVDLRLGQRLTVFHDVSDPPDVEDSREPPGKIVKIYGTVRVDGWDKNTRVARTTLIESLDPVERGFQVGPVGRRFDVVPPVAATENVEARLIAGVYPHLIFGQNQLVFIDKGKEDKLMTGNRLRVIRRGDTWSRQLTTANRHARTRVELGSPDLPKPEVTPIYGDDEQFPDEVVGELVVLRTEDYSAICLVTEATGGLEPGDRAVAVAGY
jgi:LysM repeat protein